MTQCVTFSSQELCKFVWRGGGVFIYVDPLISRAGQWASSFFSGFINPTVGFLSPMIDSFVY